MIRPLAGGALAIAVIVGFVACSNPRDEGDVSAPVATPSRSSSAPTPATESSADEEAIFEEALRRWKEFGRRSRPIMAEGKATERSAALYQEFFHDWQAQQTQLEQLEQGGITFSGKQTVSWYRPSDVRLTTVTIEACVKEEARAFKDGAELAPAGPSHPYVLTIQLSRVDLDSPFRIDAAVPDTTQQCT